MQKIGLDAVLNNVPDFTAGMNKMNAGVDSFVNNSKQQGSAFAGGFGEIVTGALRKIGELGVQALLKAGQAVAGFVKESIGLAGDFEANMLQFQSVAGKDVDAKGLEQFKALFLDIGKRLPVSTAEVQRAAIEMVKGGIDPAIIAAGGLEQNIQFAAAAMSGDLVKAAEISSKILGGWSDTNATAAEKAGFLAHAQDMLAKAANASATDVDGLSRGIFQSQGIAKTAGVSFDDLTTTLALLAPRFASSAEAGTSVKNMIARLQPTTAPAIEAMTQLGLYTKDAGTAFYDAQGNFVGFEQASALLQTSLQGLTKEQQAQALQAIFGNDAMSAAAALADGGSAAYANMAQKLAEANGVSEAAALKQQGYNTALENAKGSVEALQITVGTALLPVLADLMNNVVAPGVNILTDLASSGDVAAATFAGLSPVMKDVATTAKMIFDAFESGDFSAVIAGIVSDIKSALPQIDAQLALWARAFLNWIGPMIPPFLAELGKIGLAFVGWIGDQASVLLQKFVVWKDAFLAWIPGATVTFLAEWPKMFENFLDWIGREAGPLLKKLGDWALAMVAWIVPMIPGFLAALGKVTIAIGIWAVETAAVLAMKIATVWLPALLDWVAKEAIPGLLKALGGLLDSMMGWVTQAQNDLGRQMREVGTSMVTGIQKGLSEAWSKLTSWMSDKVHSLVDDALAAIGAGSPAKDFAPVGESIVTGMMLGLTREWPSLQDKLGGLSADLIDQMKGIGEAANDALAGGFTATATMDRQIAANLDKLAEITDPFRKQFETLMLAQQQKRATDLFADPAVAAQYFKIQSDNEFEVLKIRQQIADATTQMDKDRFTQQLTLIQAAQGAEERAFQAQQANKASPVASLIDQIQNVMTQSGLGILDNPAIGALQHMLDQLRSVGHLAAGGPVQPNRPYWVGENGPELFMSKVAGMIMPSPTAQPSMRAPAPAMNNQTSYNQQTSFNMPIYTNQSPQVIQSSFAIARAALL